MASTSAPRPTRRLVRTWALAWLDHYDALRLAAERHLTDDERATIDVGLAAVHRLGRDEVEHAVAALPPPDGRTEADVEATWGAFSLATGSAPPRPSLAIGSLRTAFSEAGPALPSDLPTPAADEALAVLRFYARTARACEVAGDRAGLCVAARAAVCALHALARSPAPSDR
jgi:hypothetical protein